MYVLNYPMFTEHADGSKAHVSVVASRCHLDAFT